MPPCTRPKAPLPARRAGRPLAGGGWGEGFSRWERHYPCQQYHGQKACRTETPEEERVSASIQRAGACVSLRFVVAPTIVLGDRLRSCCHSARK